MNVNTLKALKGSIRKWKKIVAGTGEDDGPLNCPLCHLFLSPDAMESDDDCIGCPVMKSSGKRYCEETPYDAYAKAIRGLNQEKAEKFAVRELEFLQSLLP